MKTNNKRGRPRKTFTQILDEMSSAKKIRVSWVTYSRNSEGKEIRKKREVKIDSSTASIYNEENGKEISRGYINIKYVMASLLLERAWSAENHSSVDFNAILKIAERLDGKPVEKIETTEFSEYTDITNDMTYKKALDTYKQNLGI